MLKRIKRLIRLPEEHGQGLAEYALILILASMIVLFVLILFGESVGEFYCGIMYELKEVFGLDLTGSCEEGEEAEAETLEIGSDSALPVPWISLAVT